MSPAASSLAQGLVSELLPKGVVPLAASMPEPIPPSKRHRSKSSPSLDDKARVSALKTSKEHERGRTRKVTFAEDGRMSNEEKKKQKVLDLAIVPKSDKRASHGRSSKEKADERPGKGKIVEKTKKDPKNVEMEKAKSVDKKAKEKAERLRREAKEAMEAREKKKEKNAKSKKVKDKKGKREKKPQNGDEDEDNDDEDDDEEEEEEEEEQEVEEEKMKKKQKKIVWKPCKKSCMDGMFTPPARIRRGSSSEMGTRAEVTRMADMLGASSSGEQSSDEEDEGKASEEEEECEEGGMTEEDRDDDDEDSEPDDEEEEKDDGQEEDDDEGEDGEDGSLDSDEGSGHEEARDSKGKSKAKELVQATEATKKASGALRNSSRVELISFVVCLWLVVSS